MGRAPCCLKVGLNRGTWTPEEDALLSRHIEAHGEGRWRNLPKAAGLLRCGKSCRLRWVNYLRPTVRRGNISEDEEDLIIRMHSLLGNRWSLIAARLPGRTDNEIKNYWNTCLRKKLKGINPTTHKILGTSACRKYAKVDQNICQRSLKNSDPECTEKVPYMNIRPESPDQSGAAISGPHSDRRADGNFNASTIIVSDNELRDVLTEPSSIDSCEVLSKNGKEASSLYGSTRRNNHLQQVKSSDFVITDYSISSPKTVGSFESVQMDQTGPHSRVVREFIECSASKCSSPSSDSTTSTSCSIANVSYLGFTNHIESDNNTKSKERGDFASREHYTFEPKNAMNLLPHTADSEVEKNLNQKEALTESGLFVFPPDSTDPRSIHSGPLQFPEEPIEKDIWNFVDKLSTGEHWEALEPFTHSCEYWNVPACTTTSSLDFQVKFVDFS